MKGYMDVVRNRYDGYEKDRGIYDNQYSLINPAGFYGAAGITKVFYCIMNKLRNMGIDIVSRRFLDVGCGAGFITRYYAELVQSTSNIWGIDLSSARIEQARKMNSNITYINGDIINMNLSDNSFDIVSAMDVFMHFNAESEIVRALNNIHSCLCANGIFIWYDACTKDHFLCKEEDDSSGYSRYQMENFCAKAGFQKMFALKLFKNILWRFNSVYLCNRLPMKFVSVVEKLLPGPPSNIAIVFKKK